MGHKCRGSKKLNRSLSAVWNKINPDLYNHNAKVPGDTIDETYDDNIVNNKIVSQNLSKQEQEMIEYNAETDDKYDERSCGEIIRGNEFFLNSNGQRTNKIIGYSYKIYIRDEKPLIGEFSREEMDRIYHLYSNMDGAGLTLRTVSREFPFLNYRDFKRILRAFNITKSSLAVAPHILEEYSEEEVVSLIRRNKENSILKKLDLDRQKYYEKKYFETQKEINIIKSNSDWIKNLIDSYFEKRKPINQHKINQNLKKPERLLKEKSTKSNFEKEKNEKPLFCIFGDVHYGKYFENTILGRGYNKDIAHERIMQIANITIEEAKRLNTKEIIIVSLGDLIECALEDGMHPGHSMEMDLFQEEQIFFAIDSLIEMLNEFINKTDCKITFCSIHGNHDRMGAGRDDDKSRTAGKVISGMIKRIMLNEKFREKNFKKLKRLSWTLNVKLLYL